MWYYKWNILLVDPFKISKVSIWEICHPTRSNAYAFYWAYTFWSCHHQGEQGSLPSNNGLQLLKPEYTVLAQERHLYCRLESILLRFKIHVEIFIKGLYDRVYIKRGEDMSVCP